jgi:prepilin-type N-terminal cleavage/methylation domain-containing protein/prepilin-type processing-associated H-X9-DG protein
MSLLIWRWRRAFTVIELLVVVAIIGTMIGLTLSAVMRVREAANRTRCADNLRQIGLALHHYHDVHQQLPPGTSFRNGKDPFPYMSWLTRLLPFEEQDALWRESERAFALSKDFRESPPHVAFKTPLRLYACPSDPRTIDAEIVRGLEVAFTDYLGNEGISLRELGGVLYLDSRVRLTDVTDGASKTLLVGERPPSADGILGWWYAGWGQQQDGSAEVVLGVLEKNYYDEGSSCPKGPYQFGPGKPKNLCDTFHFWSLHAGHGANFLFCDGSVHFIPYTAKAIMPALATRAGGEVVDWPK